MAALDICFLKDPLLLSALLTLTDRAAIPTLIDLGGGGYIAVPSCISAPDTVRDIFLVVYVYF